MPKEVTPDQVVADQTFSIKFHNPRFADVVIDKELAEFVRSRASGHTEFCGDFEDGPEVRSEVLTIRYFDQGIPSNSDEIVFVIDHAGNYHRITSLRELRLT